MTSVVTGGSPVVSLPFHQHATGGPPVATFQARCWALLIGCALLVGCQQSATPVSGRVTLDGQPLSEALVMFVPLEAGRKKTGATINQGGYKVLQQTGLMPGKYRVEIIDNPPLELAHRPKKELDAIIQSRRVIPALYRQNSPLSVEIGGKTSQNLQQLDFELRSNLPH